MIVTRLCVCVCVAQIYVTEIEHFIIGRLIVYSGECGRSEHRSFYWKFSDIVMKFLIHHTELTFSR